MHESSHAKRRVRRRACVSGGSARVEGALLGLAPGDDLSIITDGSMSMIDIIRALLSAVGPSHAAIATWTMGIYDAEDCLAFVSDGRILSMRMMVDPSIFGRRPELSAQLVRGFGVDAFWACNVHAKFCVLHGGRFPVVVRSSMNLNPNRRIECADVSACEELAAFFLAFVDRVWSEVAVGNRSQSESVFQRLFDGDSVGAGCATKAKLRSVRSAVRMFGT